MSGMEPMLIMGALSAASTVMSAVGQYEQQNAAAEAERQSYAAQAEASAANARLAASNEQIALNQGKEAQAEAKTGAYKAMGRQRAALAQAGLAGSGTGLLLQNESELNAEREQLQIGQQAEMNALGYGIQKSNALQSSAVSLQNKSNVQGGSKLGLAGGILGGVAKGYGAYSNYGGLGGGSGKYWDSALQKHVSTPVRH